MKESSGWWTVEWVPIKHTDDKLETKVKRTYLMHIKVLWHISWNNSEARKQTFSRWRNVGLSACDAIARPVVRTCDSGSWECASSPVSLLGVLLAQRGHDGWQEWESTCRPLWTKRLDAFVIWMSVAHANNVVWHCGVQQQTMFTTMDINAKHNNRQRRVCRLWNEASGVGVLQPGHLSLYKVKPWNINDLTMSHVRVNCCQS